MGTPSSRRGRKKTDGCAVLVALAGSLIGLGVLMGEAARWIA